MQRGLLGDARRPSRVIPRRGGWILAGTLVLCALSLSALVDLSTGRPRLEVDASVDTMLPAADEGRLFYQQVKETFLSGETMLIALAADDVFTPQTLGAIQRMTERIEELELVLRVSSLATAVNIRSEDGELLVEPFYEEVPEDAAGLEDLRRRALSDPIYAGNLVSPSGDVSVVIVYLLDVPERELIRSGAIAEIERIAREEAGEAEIWLSGGAHVNAEMSALMLDDMARVIPIALLFMSAVAYVSFRTLRGVVVPMATVGISILMTMALVSLLFGVLNNITVAAPPVLIVVGFSYAIHVLAAYYEAVRAPLRPDESAAEAMTRALGEVTVPVIFTAITTAAGFFSLMTSSLQAIQQFGAFCGLGVLITMVVSLTFAPGLVALLPIPRGLRERAGSDALDGVLTRLGEFDLRNRIAILAAGAGVALIAFAGMFRIEIGTDMIGIFEPTHPVRVDFSRVNESLEGANAFDVVFSAPEAEAWKDPANLALLESFQQWADAQPEVGGTTSLADYVKVIHRGFSEDEGAPGLPGTRDLVSQLLIIGGNDELEQFVDAEYRTARVVVRTTAMDGADVVALVDRMEERLASLGERIRARVTGNTVLLSRTQDDLAYGQATSLLTAFFFIYLILALLFTSFRIGAVALIPNVLPVLAYFGILGWSGVTLNTTTGLVACLVLGIAVDDTIHLFAHFNAAAKRSLDEDCAVVEALRAVGRPVSYTTAALCLGFMTLLLSDMRNQVEFGALAAATLAFAWLVDMTFSPAIAARMRVVNLWDVLTLDLGDSPERTIPLFAGLSRAQARVTALLAGMRAFHSGEQVVRSGASGDEMYVVIDGELTASVESSSGVSVTIRKLSRGDVIGEVALFHPHGRRTADVRADSAVRLLCLTRDDLMRLNRRYPRIGARVHANLAAVLADRLADVTERYGEGSAERGPRARGGS